MITAVDTSVLVDVFGADRRFVTASVRALAKCRREGLLVACEVVWAECRAGFGDDATLSEAMSRARVEFRPLDVRAALAAGRIFREYRSAGGTRDRLIGDFLVGSHAALQADRLLARDRGFYRDYFDGLSVLDPADA